MVKPFSPGRAALFVGIMLGFGSLYWGPTNARAGTIEILISEGAFTYDILDNGPLDTQPAANLIQALATALVFPDFTIVGLNASTKQPRRGESDRGGLDGGG
jgi:hypothetical protein